MYHNIGLLQHPMAQKLSYALIYILDLAEALRDVVVIIMFVIGDYFIGLLQINFPKSVCSSVSSHVLRGDEVHVV